MSSNAIFTFLTEYVASSSNSVLTEALTCARSKYCAANALAFSALNGSYTKSLLPTNERSRLNSPSCKKRGHVDARKRERLAKIVRVFVMR
ncbi:ORF41 peptide [Hyphantria cunea nucleopolyhedrovirus]|uniref:ORF41 peptide n=1 Tax=Hyphantria cunea nuclear polyhedrosis virus TaxID=28288 RepID=Q2NNU8_NPVHC|nr:ORF41 peptide [Hyphantria cunea nucleopolyhedrovirus]BAE72330.1 ORF41 peptide [Hyphantria cunea nucleopolyhedrovirus]